MNNSRSFFFMPPLAKISGGMSVIMDIYRILENAGHNAHLVSNGQVPAKLCGSSPVLELNSVNVGPDDRWIIPEGWPLALGKGLGARAKCVVYVQNWAFLHDNLPSDLQWRQLPVKMLAVSEPVAHFVRQTMGQNPPIIRPAIAKDIFYAPEKKTKNQIIIAWMPRKNKALAKQIHNIYAARRDLLGLPEVRWLEIADKTPAEVGGILRQAHIFLSTGFPEGLGLPPLEAMACGCIAAGFTGIGGWDYMRQIAPASYGPSFPLPQMPWGGNGFYVEDANSIGAALALEEAVKLVAENGEKLARARQAALDAAAWYSLERQRQEVLALWANDDFWK